jgi:hypothetical protein
VGHESVLYNQTVSITSPPAIHLDAGTAGIAVCGYSDPDNTVTWSYDNGSATGNAELDENGGFEFDVPNNTGSHEVTVTASRSGSGLDPAIMELDIFNNSFEITEGTTAAPIHFDPWAQETGTITLTSEVDDQVDVKIYAPFTDDPTTLGEDMTLVRTLATSLNMYEGENEIIWDGKDDANAMVPAGTYTYTLCSSNPLLGGSSMVGGVFVVSDTSVGPTISNIQQSNVVATTVDLSWSTEVSATSELDVTDSTGAVVHEKKDSALTQSHQMVVDGLQPSTTYYYRVRSANSSGQLSISATRNVTTAVGPAISQFETSSGDTTIGFSWKTDIAADTQVEYGTTRALGSSTMLYSEDVTDHSALLENLSENTVYYARARSTDENEHLSLSEIVEFNTNSTEPTLSTDLEDGSVVSGEVEINISASDTAGMGKVTIMADDLVLATLTSTPYQYTLDTTQLEDGDHVITVIADNAYKNSTIISPLVSSYNTSSPPSSEPNRKQKHGANAKPLALFAYGAESGKDNDWFKARAVTALNLCKKRLKNIYRFESEFAFTQQTESKLRNKMEQARLFYFCGHGGADAIASNGQGVSGTAIFASEINGNPRDPDLIKILTPYEFVFLDSCDSGDGDFPNKFLQSGKGGFLGWHGASYVLHTYASFTQAFWECFTRSPRVTLGTADRWAAKGGFLGMRYWFPSWRVLDRIRKNVKYKLRIK